MEHSKSKIKVAIVEPHIMIGKGLQLMFEEMKDFEVVTLVTGSCQYFMERVIVGHPDVLVINPSILDYKKRGDVNHLMEETHCSVIAALVYQYIEPDILKQYHVVVDVSDDQIRLGGKFRKLIQSEKAEIETSELTSREKEILISVSKGMPNKEIADKYNLSIHTVITHRKNITKKTGIKSVSGLTVYSILNNLIDIQEIE